MRIENYAWILRASLHDRPGRDPFHCGIPGHFGFDFVQSAEREEPEQIMNLESIST
jgi:hypothetical protein